MGRMNTLAVMMVVFLIVVACFISPLVAQKFIGYPAMAKGRIPKQKSPPRAANPYHRSCETTLQCRQEASTLP
ncbi:hypothetical protein ACP275_13G043400 [Erythranthe tilingii]